MGFGTPSLATPVSISNGGTAAATAPIAISNLGLKFAYKGSDTARINTTTPAADPDLVIAVAANTVYDFILWAPCTVASVVPNFKGGMNFPTSPTTALWQFSMQGNTTVAQTFGVSGDNTGNGATGLSSGLTYIFKVTGVLINGANAGNISFLWSQNTTSADALTFLKGAWMSVTARA